MTTGCQTDGGQIKIKAGRCVTGTVEDCCCIDSSACVACSGLAPATMILVASGFDTDCVNLNGTFVLDYLTDEFAGICKYRYTYPTAFTVETDNAGDRDIDVWFLTLSKTNIRAGPGESSGPTTEFSPQTYSASFSSTDCDSHSGRTLDRDDEHLICANPATISVSSG